MSNTTKRNPAGGPGLGDTSQSNEQALQADINAAAAFLCMLDQSTDQFCFRSFSDAGALPAANYTGTLEHHAAALAADNSAGRGVFVVVNAGGQRGNDIDRVRAVFADFDGAPLEPALFCSLAPQLVVESSPGRWHAYWLVDGMPLAQFKPTQQAIAARFNADPTVCDLPRVMRLPGFLHRKGEPFLSRLIHATGAPAYTAAQILAEFPPLAIERSAPSNEAAVVVDIGRHEDMARLAARVAGLGLGADAVLATLQSEADRGRWTREFGPDEIERAVLGAVSKYESGEWQLATDLGAMGFGGELPSGALVTPAPRFKLTPAGELLETPRPLSWLVRGLLLPGTTSMLVGDPLAGKSLALVDIASCIATGRDWCGRSVQRGFVVYLAGEGQHGIRRRLLAWSIVHGSELASAPIVVSDRGASLNEPASLRDVVQAIDAAVLIYGAPLLVVVDTLHRNLAGDESSAKDIAAYFNAVDVLRTRYGSHVVTAHHSGHGDKDRARGSSSLRAAVDTELLLTVSGGIRTLQMTKQKDGPTQAPMNFALQEVQLPWVTDDGTPETSVVLSPTTAVATKIRVLSPVQKLAMETLNGCGGIRVPLEKWRVAFYEQHSGDSPDAKKKAFRRVRTDLIEIREIEHENDAYSVAGQSGPQTGHGPQRPGPNGPHSYRSGPVARHEHSVEQLSKMGFGE